MVHDPLPAQLVGLGGHHGFLDLAGRMQGVFGEMRGCDEASGKPTARDVAAAFAGGALVDSLNKREPGNVVLLAGGMVALGNVLDKKRRKSLGLPGDNGAYLDSLAWVLYKKKQYKEAKEILLKAVEDKESQHIEIYDHLGDVYLVLGEREAANRCARIATDAGQIGDGGGEADRCRSGHGVHIVLGAPISPRRATVTEPRWHKIDRPITIYKCSSPWLSVALRGEFKSRGPRPGRLRDGKGPRRTCRDGCGGRLRPRGAPP